MHIYNRSSLNSEFVKNTILKLTIPQLAAKLVSVTLTNKVKDSFSGQFLGNRISVDVGNSSQYPRYNIPKEWISILGYKRYLINTIEESFVRIYAHELRHAWQKWCSNKFWNLDIANTQIFLGDDGMETIGSDTWEINRPAEKDADAWAYKQMKEYRKNALDIAQRT